MILKKNIAFFDLDYTVIPHDTLFLFSSFVLKKKPLRIYYLIFLIPAFFLYMINLLSAQRLKRAFLTILAGLSKKEVESFVDEFTDRLIDHAYPEILEEIKRHKSNKTTLILNTASPVFYIEPLGKKLGFDICVGSEFTLEEKMPLFIKPQGRNNKKYVKLDHMKEYIDNQVIESVKENKLDLVIPNSDSYSDSPSDLPLLLIAERKHVVHPGKELRELASKHTWKVWKPKKPFRSGFGKLVVSASQMLGFFNL